MGEATAFRLSELLRDFPPAVLAGVPAATLAKPVSGVTSDSRAVGPAKVFVAVSGARQDGHGFLAQAEKAGALLLIGERDAPAGLSAPYLRVADSRLALAWIAARAEGDPSHGMKVVGVTGTSGKTTTTFVIDSILRAAGHRTGLIGTIQVRVGDAAESATHTTPGPVELQRLLARMRDAGCTAVVMEVSSHALKQHRVAGVAFDAMVFTNLTPEHLDFHPDMEDYFQSKAMLFGELADYSREKAGKKPAAAVNADDPYGRRLIAEVVSQHGSSSVPFGMGASGAGVDGGGLRVGLSGIQGSAGGVAVSSRLAGTFNAYNIMAAIAAARGLGLDPLKVAAGIAALGTVPGRLEPVANAHGIHVLIDYAHKADALERVLRALAGTQGAGRLLTVFGCGGDRDRLKRPVMGRTAAELSDLVWITSDNPRTEDPGAIIEEIKRGVAPADLAKVVIEPDRRRAIHAAIGAAKAGDVVLIAGKGHEDYQILAAPGTSDGTRKIHFDDREVAAEALEARS